MQRGQLPEDYLENNNCFGEQLFEDHWRSIAGRFVDLCKLTAGWETVSPTTAAV